MIEQDGWKMEETYENTRFRVWRNGDQYQLREGEVVIVRYSEKDFHPSSKPPENKSNPLLQSA